MKRISFYLILMIGCTSQEDNLTSELFPTRKNSQLVNLDSVKNVDNLTDLYCQKAESDKSVKLSLPYNFQTKEFDKQANTGIDVFGHPMHCFYVICCRRTLKFDAEEKKWMTDYLVSTNEQSTSNLDSLVKLNIMNNGYDPSLSENPKDAIFEISAYPEKKLESLKDVIGDLALAYQKFLKSRISDSLSIDSLKKVYPLQIMISELQDLPPVPMDTTFMDEIEGEIEIDFNENDIKHGAVDTWRY